MPVSCSVFFKMVFIHFDPVVIFASPGVKAGRQNQIIILFGGIANKKMRCIKKSPVISNRGFFVLIPVLRPPQLYLKLDDPVL